MPALITHHLFGEESVHALPTGVVEGEEQLLAFLLGNQGPDPFFFRFFGTPANVSASQQLAHRMHNELMSRAFETLRKSVSSLPAQDAGVGRAFALGMLSHYALDRVAHPYVYAQQYALLDANDELSDAAGEVHALIEADLDTWMLWRMRHTTVAECLPGSELMRTERIERVAGALASQVAWEVFDIQLPATEYAGAIANMELVYDLIEPAGSSAARLVGNVERLVRPHSRVQALAHVVSTSDECAAANLGHDEWVSPFTGATSTASFDEVFDDALAQWPALAEAFTRGGELAREAIAHLNYSGRPLGTDERFEGDD